MTAMHVHRKWTNANPWKLQANSIRLYLQEKTAHRFHLNPRERRRTHMCCKRKQKVAATHSLRYVVMNFSSRYFILTFEFLIVGVGLLNNIPESHINITMRSSPFYLSSVHNRSPLYAHTNLRFWKCLEKSSPSLFASILQCASLRCCHLSKQFPWIFKVNAEDFFISVVASTFLDHMQNICVAVARLSQKQYRGSCECRQIFNRT